MNNQVHLDSGEMKEFLQHIINNNRYLRDNGKSKKISAEVIGDSGLGKTSVVLQIAKENNLDIVKLNLAQIEELGDLVGFPIRQFELCKKLDVKTSLEAPQTEIKKLITGDGRVIHKKVIVNTPVNAQTEECIWVDENAVEQYIKRDYEFTGNKRMSYCPPEWIADKKGGGILMLDDWNRADPRFIQACMELIDRGEYISWKLPEDWHIILTANPDDGDYMVNTLDVAQKTRFVSILMKWSPERWGEWAEEEELDGRCINFVLLNPEIVTKSVNPRSITTFFYSISSIKNFEEQLSLIQMLGEGSVGNEVASLFTTFIHNKLDKLITPKQMLNKGSHEEIKTELMSNINDGNIYRADIASVLNTRFLNYVLNQSKNGKIDKDQMSRIKFLIKDNDLFTNDMKYHMVKKLIVGNKNVFKELTFDPIIQEYATK